MERMFDAKFQDVNLNDLWTNFISTLGRIAAIFLRNTIKANSDATKKESP